MQEAEILEILVSVLDAIGECAEPRMSETRASRRSFYNPAVQRHSSCVTPLQKNNDRGSSDDYVYGPSGTPIEQINESTGVPTYLYTDQLGSVTMEADQSGSVIGTQSYSPYGSLDSSTGTDSTPFGFAGGYTDPTGLIYLINRYYDSATGQFLSVDPLVGDTQQPYSYAGDDPINSVDPIGQDAFERFKNEYATVFLESKCTGGVEWWIVPDESVTSYTDFLWWNVQVYVNGVLFDSKHTGKYKTYFVMNALHGTVPPGDAPYGSLVHLEGYYTYHLTSFVFGLLEIDATGTIPPNLIIVR